MSASFGIDDAELGDEARFVLEALADQPSLSQRQLARRVGLSLTKAHFVLKRLTEKGLIKMRNVARSEHKLGYFYALTPKGLDAKARLTYRFLNRMALEYQQLVERVEDLLEASLTELPRSHGKKKTKIVVVGEGPLAEVVKDLLGLHPDTTLVTDTTEAELGIVVDPEAARDLPRDMKIIHVA